MDHVVSEIIKIVKEKNIKVITVSESNHRSYTCHTFFFKLMKALYNNKIINTFSSEKLGIFDSIVVNYYLKKNISIKKLKKDVNPGGMGIDRWLKFLRNKDPDSYVIAGAEFDYYQENDFSKIPKNLFLEFFSPEFTEDLLTGADEKDIRVVNENDKLIKSSFVSVLDFYKKRESFWLRNIKKILKERDNLFVVGFHMAKRDPIGKYIKKIYKEQSLLIGMSAYEISTQLLIIDGKKYNSNVKFNKALEERDYTQTVGNISDFSPPTTYEKYLKSKYGDWKLMKKKNVNKDHEIRGVGCYIAMSDIDYKKKKIIKEVNSKVGDYDYIIFFNKSVYRENMNS